MFRAFKCSSSGDAIVSIRYLVYVTLTVWYADLDVLSKPAYQMVTYIGKGKAVPLQAWSGPESPRKLRFLDFMTTAQGGGKVVSLTHRPHLLPGNSPGTHFC